MASAHGLPGGPPRATTAMSSAAAMGAAAAHGPAAAPVRPAAERIAELEELRRRGLLSDAEYADKRAEILRSL